MYSRLIHIVGVRGAGPPRNLEKPHKCFGPFGEQGLKQVKKVRERRGMKISTRSLQFIKCEAAVNTLGVFQTSTLHIFYPFKSY